MTIGRRQDAIFHLLINPYLELFVLSRRVRVCAWFLYWMDFGLRSGAAKVVLLADEISKRWFCPNCRI